MTSTGHRFSLDLRPPGVDAGSNLQTAAELAGFATEVTGAIGTESSALPTSMLAAEAEIRGGELVWSWGPESSDPRDILEQAEAAAIRAALADRSGMLDAFIRLADETSVLDFAKRFGPLLLCEHGYPAPHSIELGEDSELLRAPVERSSSCSIAKRESVEDWLSYAGWAKAIIRVAAEIESSPVGERPSHQRVFSEIWLENHVGFWIKAAGVRPRLSFAGGESRLDFAGTGAFAILALQMLTAVTRSNDIATCDSCGHPYLPKRKPAAGRAKYCTRDECQRVAARNRKRRQRPQTAPTEEAASADAKESNGGKTRT